MSTRILIAIAAAAWALPMPKASAQAQGPDTFIPTQPPKAGADANASESRAVKYALILPNEKSSESVKPEERNPFGKTAEEAHDDGTKSSSEETKIQEQLSRLRATGLSPGPNGLRVLLGDMWLSKNDLMPAVVKDQTLALRVNEVTRDAIQLVWMEKKFTGLPPRLLVIPVDLRPTVRRVPHGELPEKSEAKVESRASKRATHVELPAPIAARTEPAKAGEASQVAIAPAGPAAPPPSNGPVVIASTPGKLPSLGGPVPLPQPKVDPAPATTSPATPEIAGPPAPPASSKVASIPTPPATPAPTQESAPLIAGPPAPPQTVEATAPKLAAQPVAPVPAATEPAAWKRAMGLMDNLVKLSEANK